LTAQPAQTSPFNFNASTTQPATTTGSIFGATTNTQSPISANKPFGSTGFGSTGLNTSLSVLQQQQQLVRPVVYSVQ